MYSTRPPLVDVIFYHVCYLCLICMRMIAITTLRIHQLEVFKFRLTVLNFFENLRLNCS